MQESDDVKLDIMENPLFIMNIQEALCVIIYCVPVFSAEPYNDTSYNATQPYGGELFPVWAQPVLALLLSPVPQ